MIEVFRLEPGDEHRVLAAAFLFDIPPDAQHATVFLADPSSYLLLASIDGKPAGFIRAHELLTLEPPGRQMFLYEIGTEEAYRRRGVARALIEELLRYARERGCSEVFVLSNASSDAAMRLYESTGGVRENPDDVMFVYPL
jgi:ribosomal protein S18 acetylase RimI-like enzyme